MTFGPRCIAPAAELEQLRSITNVARLGRVRRIEKDGILLDDGTIPTNTGTLHIDCSADGAEQRPAVPVFKSEQITLQSVSLSQQVQCGIYRACRSDILGRLHQERIMCSGSPPGF